MLQFRTCKQWRRNLFQRGYGKEKKNSWHFWVFLCRISFMNSWYGNRHTCSGAIVCRTLQYISTKIMRHLQVIFQFKRRIWKAIKSIYKPLQTPYLRFNSCPIPALTGLFHTEIEIFQSKTPPFPTFSSRSVMSFSPLCTSFISVCLGP